MIEGLRVKFYKGIGGKEQFICPLQRINIFVGANNAGKSIVLNLLGQHVSRMQGGSFSSDLDAIDVFRGSETGVFSVQIAKPTDWVISRALRMAEGRISQRSHLRQYIESAFDRVLNSISENGCVWFAPAGGRHAEGRFNLLADEARALKLATTEDWELVWNVLTGSSGGGFSAHHFPQTLKSVATVFTGISSGIHILPAKRQLGKKGEVLEGLSGIGLIDALAGLQNPSYDQQHKKEKFKKINDFLKYVTGNEDALLEIPHDRDHVLVHMNNKVLPLSSLGTGIHEVVLIASYCTMYDQDIICMEEPEIHLHPLLQRKLVEYITNQTSNQYFIATHSSSIIDRGNANIFLVKNDGDQTYIDFAASPKQIRGVLDELGCQASDILQANCVIWVEGPSDRIYLRHWLSCFDRELVEGIHYTIMFYGGALVRHLSGSDESIDEFIKLRSLNRNMVIVLDSDRADPAAPLKPAAERILKEMDGDGGMVWVTDGREVENYVDYDVLQGALKKVHSRLYDGPAGKGKYEHNFYFMRKAPKEEGKRVKYVDGDKVKVAAIVCDAAANFDVFDLRERIGEVAALVRRANNLPPVS